MYFICNIILRSRTIIAGSTALGSAGLLIQIIFDGYIISLIILNLTTQLQHPFVSLNEYVEYTDGHQDHEPTLDQSEHQETECVHANLIIHELQDVDVQLAGGGEVDERQEQAEGQRVGFVVVVADADVEPGAVVLVHERAAVAVDAVPADLRQHRHHALRAHARGFVLSVQVQQQRVVLLP